MTYDPLRARLEQLLKSTDGAQATVSWWVGDRATERQALDDLASGRRYRMDAHRMAENGIRLLDAGDRDGATTAAWAATDFYTAFLESWIRRVKPSERPSIAPAKPRGRRARKNK